MALDTQTGSAIVVEELTRLKERIIANMQAQGAVATGGTIRSLQVVSDGSSIALKSMQRMPFGTLETGRRAGATPHGFITVIRAWMQAKGIKAAPIPYKQQPSERWQPKYTPQERGDMSMAGAIAHTIREKGTRLFRQGGRATIYSNEIPQTVERVKQRLSAIIRANVEESIKINTQSI